MEWSRRRRRRMPRVESSEKHRHRWRRTICFILSYRSLCLVSLVVLFFFFDFNILRSQIISNICFTVLSSVVATALPAICVYSSHDEQFPLSSICTRSHFDGIANERAMVMQNQTFGSIEIELVCLAQHTARDRSHKKRDGWPMAIYTRLTSSTNLENSQPDYTLFFLHRQNMWIANKRMNYRIESGCFSIRFAHSIDIVCFCGIEHIKWNFHFEWSSGQCDTLSVYCFVYEVHSICSSSASLFVIVLRPSLLLRACVMLLLLCLLVTAPRSHLHPLYFHAQCVVVGIHDVMYAGKIVQLVFLP